MENMIKIISVSILCVASLVLLVILVIPWPEATQYIAQPSGVENPIPQEAQKKDSHQLVRYSPRTLAALFGYEPPKSYEPITEIRPDPVPARAEWLLPMGYVVSADGVRRYVFKITSTRDVIISLAQGESEAGVKLGAVEDERFVVEWEEETYFVPKATK